MTLTMTRRSHEDGPVLLTGATGFVGMELLVRLLEQTDRDVVALVRAADDAAAAARIDKLLQMLLAPATAPRHAARVHAVAADLECPGLGLSDATRDRLTASIGAVVHCAASVSFTLELEDARRINVEGTREIMQLAARRTTTACSTASCTSRRRTSPASATAARASARATSARASATPTSARSSRPSRSCTTAACRPRSSARASSSATASPAGRRASTSSTGRCRRSRAGCSTRSPAIPTRRSTSCRSTSSPTRCSSSCTGPVRCGPFHVVASDEAVSNGRLATMAAEFFDTAPPTFVGPGVDPSAEVRAGVFMSYFKVRCVFDALRGRRTLGAKPPRRGSRRAR